jgi:hypothetical protein
MAELQHMHLEIIPGCALCGEAVRAAVKPRFQILRNGNAFDTHFSDT